MKAKALEERAAKAAEAKAVKEKIAAERAEKNAAARAERGKREEEARAVKAKADAAKAEAQAKRKAALEAEAKHTADLAKKAMEKAEADAKAAKAKAEKEQAAAKAEADKEAKKNASKKAPKASKANVKTNDNAASSKTFRAPARADVEALAATGKAKVAAVAVAVDAGAPPYVATAAAAVGVRPSIFVAGAFATVAAVAATVSSRGSDEDEGYAAFDNKPVRRRSNADGGLGREGQRAYLEKQLEADREAQRSRWQAAMGDGPGPESSSIPVGEATKGARARRMNGLGDAAVRADGEPSDEKRRLERIREMNRVSTASTAVAEARLREAAAASTATATANETEETETEVQAKMSAAARRRAEAKRRAEEAVLGEYQRGPDDDGETGWDAQDVKEMQKQYQKFLRASKANKWWSRGGDFERERRRLQRRRGVGGDARLLVYSAASSASSSMSNTDPAHPSHIALSRQSCSAQRLTHSPRNHSSILQNQYLRNHIFARLLAPERLETLHAARSLPDGQIPRPPTRVRQRPDRLLPGLAPTNTSTWHMSCGWRRKPLSGLTSHS